ncbi:hypothetical protein C0J52_22469 [Blattella germanica]|nr:hypothetical protein C0J52_22469 [Blattella germanica]
MWILVHWEKESLRYPPYTFTTGKDHVVSCKKGDLVITNDSSISRKHAVFSVSYEYSYMVVCALAHGRHIVTPQYWEQYLAGLPTSPLPDTKDFIPPLAEASLNMNEVSFEINEERKTLFLGYKFIFSSQIQFKNYSCMIEAAGGRPLMMCDDFTLESLRSPDVIVMQCASKYSQDSSIPSSFEKISKYLKEHNLRPIPDSEIALAILHCSTEKHCNPEFNVASMLLTNDSRNNHPEKHNIMLALDSQQHTESQSIKQGKSHDVLIIPESGTVRKEPTSRVPLQQSTEDTMIIPESGTPKKSPSKLPISHTEKNDDDVILIEDTSRRIKDKRERSSSTDNVDPSPSPLKRIKVMEKGSVKREVGLIDDHEATDELPKKIKKEEKRHSPSPESFKYSKKRKDIDSEIKPLSKKLAMDLKFKGEKIEESDSSEEKDSEKYQRNVFVHKKPKVKKLICMKIVESGEVIGVKGKNFKKFVKNKSISFSPPVKKVELRKYPTEYINKLVMKFNYADNDEDDDDDEDDDWNSTKNAARNKTLKRGR